jgi:hypothetical protein
MPRRISDQTELGSLRARVSQLRRELTDVSKSYKDAVSQHDSDRAIPLLRSRSRLMRELLEAQCELLLSFRSDEVPSTPDRPRPAPAGFKDGPVARPRLSASRSVREL